VHRRTVRQALASAVPPPRKAYRRRSQPAIGPYAVEVVDPVTDDVEPLMFGGAAVGSWFKG
jgi:hypothetical protein